MPVSAQPPGRRGTVERPYSALNLRFALAVFGFVVCGVLAGLLFAVGQDTLAWVMLAAALVAAADVVFVQLRRRSRRRADGGRRTLFE